MICYQDEFRCCGIITIDLTNRTSSMKTVNINKFKLQMTESTTLGTVVANLARKKHRNAWMRWRISPLTILSWHLAWVKPNLTIVHQQERTLRFQRATAWEICATFPLICTLVELGSWWLCRLQQLWTGKILLETRSIFFYF